MTNPPDKKYSIGKYNPLSINKIVTRSESSKIEETTCINDIKDLSKPSKYPSYKCNNCDQLFRDRKLLIIHYSKEHLSMPKR